MLRRILSRGTKFGIFFILFLLILILLPFNSEAQKILIPMDFSQTDHLKAYGVAYWCLKQGYNMEWLLNYRAGSFMADYYEDIADRCRLQGVTFEKISLASAGSIYQQIEENNMEVVFLEKAPAVAVYVPPTKEPWDDAVRLALAYAEIPYKTLWDVEVLKGELEKFDWLHLHHEDFTGQYGKFYAHFRNEPWYREEQKTCEEIAKFLGFKKVSEEKKAVAKTIKDYVARGGFLFAVCSAPETMDIALSAEEVDIVPREFDGDPPDPDCQNKLDYTKTFAFTDFTLSLNPLEYRHSDIDTQPDRLLWGVNIRNDYFTLFDFSAKLDPVPSMLVQNHVNVVAAFMGQTTGFRKSLLKKYVTILAEVEGIDEVRYIHGNYGRGTFTFLSGHDPEDYEHLVGDPPTDLNLHKNSPGYRLILNNILFPAAKKKERKT